MFNDYTNAKQVGGGCSIEKPPTSIFEELQMAQKRFFEACHALANAHAERDAANKHLAEISAKVHAQIDLALNDPTMPQPETAQLQNRANGRY